MTTVNPNKNPNSGETTHMPTPMTHPKPTLK